MRPPVQIRLHGHQLARLRVMYEETTCPRTRLRVQMVLLSHDGYAAAEIARITRKSDDTVRYWLHRFQQGGCAGLLEAPHSGRPPKITADIETFLHDCIQQSPRDFQINRLGWTTALFAKLVKRRFRVAVSAECIRQHLKRVNAVCRRPTWTVKHLAQQQAGYAQKKGRFHAY